MYVVGPEQRLAALKDAAPVAVASSSDSDLTPRGPKPSSWAPSEPAGELERVPPPALRGANLWGANLRGADLRGARYDQLTLWPLGFEVEKSGAILA